MRLDIQTAAAFIKDLILKNFCVEIYFPGGRRLKG